MEWNHLDRVSALDKEDTVAHRDKSKRVKWRHAGTETPINREYQQAQQAKHTAERNKMLATFDKTARDGKQVVKVKSARHYVLYDCSLVVMEVDSSSNESQNSSTNSNADSSEIITVLNISDFVSGNYKKGTYNWKAGKDVPSDGFELSLLWTEIETAAKGLDPSSPFNMETELTWKSGDTIKRFSSARTGFMDVSKGWEEEAHGGKAKEFVLTYPRRRGQGDEV